MPQYEVGQLNDHQGKKSMTKKVEESSKSDIQGRFALNDHLNGFKRWLA